MMLGAKPDCSQAVFCYRYLRFWIEYLSLRSQIVEIKLFFNQTSMNQYETVFILTPVLSDVQMKEAVEKFTGILKEEGAEIINEEYWGLKKLAYPIQKKSTGFYQLVEFKANPETIAKLELNFRRDERVIRFLTFKMDKYAAEYAAKRRNVKSTKKEEN
jgi:small subunit ribosomal protein S6